MASKSKLICVAFLVVFCFILLKEASDCKSGQYGCITEASYKRHSRKVLAGLMVKNPGTLISGNYGNKDQFNEWQLRRVPSGPDPLHHNGNNPKKPRSP
ncbi:hypothetical protein L484_001218 [Morus notabilis]|uniref:Uncharacterized protein n=1 Tax=Morus notabilis TaxID=981085 RepID=W9SNX7_9ROSA|nr:protein CLAVATA 3 [Morus notabilis]EXC37760.1 hypothetical protein L484_001218 [Morus notabilis]